jgi:hypothetical protein
MKGKEQQFKDKGWNDYYEAKTKALWDRYYEETGRDPELTRELVIEEYKRSGELK